MSAEETLSQVGADGVQYPLPAQVLWGGLLQDSLLGMLPAGWLLGAMGPDQGSVWD